MDYARLIGERLRSRSPELEQALLARVLGIGDPSATEDSGYFEGFRTAAAAALDFSVATLNSAAGDEPPIPPIFLLQAKLAARNKVRLDVVLRRYAAGHALIVEFAVEEAGREQTMPASALRALLISSASALDRLLLGIGDEYAHEAARCSRNSPHRSKIDRIERLLGGEAVRTDYLEYPLDGWHLGLVAEGTDADALRDLAREVDRRLLAVEPRAEAVWAWLGGRTRLDTAELAKRIRQRRLDMKIALGEPGLGIAGWRLSHRQALAVLPFAEGRPVALARYADKGVLASIQKDQVLSESLRKLYLEPLSGESDREELLGDTLRAYFAAECSTSSAASALKVHRQTVTSRLRAAEEKLGKPLSECALELTLALLIVPEATGHR